MTSNLKLKGKKTIHKRKIILYKSTKLNYDMNPVSNNKVVGFHIKQNVNVKINKINPGQIDVKDSHYYYK